MKVGFVGELRSVVKKEFTRRNGEKDYECHLTVECDGVPQYLPCSKDVGQAFENGVIKKGDMCRFTAQYQPRWKFNQFVVETALLNK